MTSELVLGPQHGTLSLHTGRQGLASKVGHDLTLHVEDWAGTVVYDAGGGLQSLHLVAQLNSLNVIRGDGGLKPLSDKDKATILKEALKTLDVKRHPVITYDADTINPESHGYRLDGTVTIVDQRRPLNTAVDVATEREMVRITSATAITQSEFGIKPYTGMLGALRLRDLVDVRVVLALASADLPHFG